MENTSITKREMVEYLRHVLELHGNANAGLQMINQMHDRVAYLGLYDEDVPELERYGTKDAIEFGKYIIKQVAASFGVWFVGLCIIILCNMVMSDRLVETPIILFTFAILIYCVFNIFYFHHEKVKKIRRYNELCNERIEAINRRKELELKEKGLLESKIKVLNSSLEETYRLLNNLYNVGDIYIYPKYRNIVAIAQILEYYESGRRDCLEGIDGAYDLYESELRQNIIIDKLTEIGKSLESIRQNQSVLYNELKHTNSILMSMENEMKQIGHSLDEVKINSYITAYNTTAVAKRVNAEEYMKMRYPTFSV